MPPAARRRWSRATRAGGFIFVAGMRGIDPSTGGLVEGARARIRQGFANMLHIAASGGAGLEDCVRIVVYVTDMATLRPLVNEVQASEKVYQDVRLEVRAFDGTPLGAAQGPSPLALVFPAHAGQPVHVVVRVEVGHGPWLATFVANEPTVPLAPSVNIAPANRLKPLNASVPEPGM